MEPDWLEYARWCATTFALGFGAFTTTSTGAQTVICAVLAVRIYAGIREITR